MALQNFQTTVLAANIMEAMRKAEVFAAVANRDYEGGLNSLGDKVKINMLADVTANSFARNTDLVGQKADDAASELVADQPYYFDIEVEDVDAVQQKPRVLAQLANKAAYAFIDKADQYLAGLYAQAGLNSYSTGTTPWDVTSLNVEEVLGDAKEKMARLPMQGRFLIVPEWFHTKLLWAGLTTKTQNDALYLNGVVDHVLGFDIILSENVSAASQTTWDHTKIMGGIRGESYSFANVISKIEAFRPEKRFSDAIKGLYVFGGKIIRPDMTICIHADKTAEA